MKPLSECILWPGTKDKDGYGRVKISGKMRGAHRVALEISIGRKLRKKEIAMHTCHTPSCINPDHLKIGTAEDNNKASRARRKTLADTHLSGWKNIYGKEPQY